MKFLDNFNTNILKELGYRRKPLYGKGFIKFQNDVSKFGKIDLIEEKISHVFEKDKRGGVITLSTDVNAIYKDGKEIFDKIKDWLDSKLKTIDNRIHRKQKVQKVLNEIPEVTGFTVGNFMNGRYKDENGRIWNEKSFSVEVIGIDKDVLDMISTELSKIFNQESVMVKSYETGDIYFAEVDDERYIESKRVDRINKLSDLL
jgi:hypothetical protein